MTVGLAREALGWRQQVEARQLAVVRRDDERLGERRDATDARRAEHVMQREHRAERVAVGTHVARQADFARGRDRAGGPRRARPRRGDRRYVPYESILVTRRPRTTFSVRAVPRSIVPACSRRRRLVVDLAQHLLDPLAGRRCPDRRTKSSFGTCRIRIWRPTTPRRCEPAERSALATVSGTESRASTAVAVRVE